MAEIILISVIMCSCLIAAILLKPSVNVKGISIGTYWPIALTGAVVLVVMGKISLSEIGRGLVSQDSINPIKILVLFLSMTVQSIFLDELGLFRCAANLALKKAKGSQKGLFLMLFLVVSLLTVFTSNDIIILTFTPFICYFSKNAGINPIPFLFTEFVAANTWSMALIIGNPTNVYLASSAGVDFLGYVTVMWLPTIFAGLVALLVLFLVFKKNFAAPLSISEDDFSIKDKGLLAIGLTHLSLCTVLLVISSYIGLEMWFITMCFALSLFVFSGVYLAVRRQGFAIFGACVKRMPWELIPFVISMFVFVLCFDKAGISEGIGKLLGSEGTIAKYGSLSFVAANLINNIPMSVLFSSVVKALPDSVYLKGVFAAVIGSNVGAFFTPIGALAGIMWTGILKKHQVSFSFLTYIKYGVIISVPTLIAALLGLGIIL